MRVVWITHSFPRFSGDIAGHFLARLAEALLARGVRLTVIAPADAGHTGADDLDGIPVRRVRYDRHDHEDLAYTGTMTDAVRSPRRLLSFWRLVRALRRAAEEELRDGAELVHAHWWIPGGLAVPRGARYVLTLHGTDVRLLGRRSGRWLGVPVVRRARVVTTVSHDLANAIVRVTGRTIPSNCIRPMPLAVGGTPWGSGGGGLLVVARLVPQKRVHLAIEALARLRDRGRMQTLTIAGDGPERDALEALAVRLGVADAVEFLGYEAPATIATHYATADVLLATSVGEGFGLVAAEALCAGVPVVVCADGGGLLDVVPKSGAGRRVAPTGQAVAEAVIDILDHPAARHAARVEGERWQRVVAPEAAAEACEGWYRAALGRK